MSYYSDSYLPRVFKGASNRYEIAQKQKERAFKKRVESSILRCRINDEEDGILNKAKYVIAADTGELLVFRDSEIEIGDMLSIHSYSLPEEEQYWLPYEEDKQLSSGYRKFYLVLLNKTITVNDHVIQCYYGNIDSIQRKFVRDTIDSTARNWALFMPSVKMGLVTSANDLLTYGDTFTIGNTTWEIDNIDKYTIQGVAFYTLKEQFHNYQHDEPVVPTVVYENDTLRIPLTETFNRITSANGHFSVVIDDNEAFLSFNEIGLDNIEYYLDTTLVTSTSVDIRSMWLKE